MEYVLNAFDFTQAIVETAVVNAPAIRLYQKHGFNEFKRFTPSHGIEKLALVKQSRLSVMEIDLKYWKKICKMAK